MFSPSSYLSLLARFEKAGYDFRFFDDHGPDGSLILRHDVDFSLEYALEMARLEQSVGATSTYFILLSTEFYNVLAPRAAAIVREIRSTGSRIGLHFDPTAYNNYNDGFELERRLFERQFSQDLDIVSLHRPRDFLRDNNKALNGVRHTYEDDFFKTIKYVSDSGGSFRFGSPFETDEFALGRTIHLNLHPIWWMRPGLSPSETIRNWQRDQLQMSNGQAVINCLTFDGVPAFKPV